MPPDPPGHLGPQDLSHTAFGRVTLPLTAENSSAMALQNCIENPAAVYTVGMK